MHINMLFKEFKLPKTGALATIEILGLQDLADVMHLQEETRAALTDDHKMFVLPQTAIYFQNLLDQRNGMMIGIRSKGKLISQMAIMGPLSVEDMIDQQKLTRNDVAFHHAQTADIAVIAKSMAVHPDYRGNELSQHMLEMALALPLTRGADHMFAQVSVENTHSWEIFLRQGFGIVAAAIDPNDQKPRFILQRPTMGFALHHMQTTHGTHPINDFAGIIRLTQREALVGQFDMDEPSKLSFHASADMAASWDDTAGAAV